MRSTSNSCPGSIRSIWRNSAGKTIWPLEEMVVFISSKISSYLCWCQTTWSVRHTRIVVSHYGGPEELQVVQEECPEPKRGEVRVRVLAAGVSLPDVMAREGIHPETPRLPFTP